MKNEFTLEEKNELEYLLSIEKASRIVGKSYEDMARTYNHTMEDGEEAEKFKTFQRIHTSTIKKLESFLLEHVG